MFVADTRLYYRIITKNKQICFNMINLLNDSRCIFIETTINVQYVLYFYCGFIAVWLYVCIFVVFSSKLQRGIDTT